MLSLFFLLLSISITITIETETASTSKTKTRGSALTLPTDSMGIIASCLRYKDRESFGKVSKSCREGTEICKKANNCLIADLTTMLRTLSFDTVKIKQIADALIACGDQQYFNALFPIVHFQKSEKSSYEEKQYFQMLNALHLFPNQELMAQLILNQQTFENTSDELILLTIASRYLSRALFCHQTFIHPVDPTLKRLMGNDHEDSSFRFLFERPFVPEYRNQKHPFNSLRHHKRWFYLNASADTQHRMVTEWHFIPWDPVMVKYVKFRYAESVWKPVFHDPLADTMCPLDLHGEGRPGNSEVAEHVLSAVKVFRDLLQRIKYSIPINPRFVDLGARHSWFNTTNIRMEKFWVKWFVDLTASIKDKIEPNSRLNHRSDTHYVVITIALGNYLRGNLAEFHRMMDLFANPIYAPSFESQTKFVLEQYRLGFQMGFL